MSRASKERARTKRRAAKKARKQANYLRNGPKQERAQRAGVRLVGTRRRKRAPHPPRRPSSARGRRRARRLRGAIRR